MSGFHRIRQGSEEKFSLPRGVREKRLICSFVSTGGSAQPGALLLSPWLALDLG